MGPLVMLFTVGIVVFGIAFPVITLAKLGESEPTAYKLAKTCTLRFQMCNHFEKERFLFIEMNDMRILHIRCDDLKSETVDDTGYTFSAYVTPDCKHFELLSVYETMFYTNLTYLYEVVPRGAYFISLTSIGGYKSMQGFYEQSNHKFYSNLYDAFGMRQSLNNEHGNNKLIPNRDPVQSLYRNNDCRDTRDGTQVWGDGMTTTSGKTCQSAPSSANGQPFTKYIVEENLKFSSSACRNPNNDPNGPWCYIDGDGNSEHCTVPYCEGTTDGLAIISRKGYNNEELASLKIIESKAEGSLIQDKVAYYNFPIEKKFCTAPLELLDRTTIEPRHYGLDDRSEARDLDFGNSKMHVVVSDPITCDNSVFGWEFIGANPSVVYAGVFRTSVGGFKAGYKEVGYTKLNITKSMIKEDNEIQYLCTRLSPIKDVKAGDYYGFYTNNKGTKLAPFKRLYVQERSNLKYPCSRQMISPEAGTVHIIDADVLSFTNDTMITPFVYDSVKRVSAGLALRPILDQDFMYSCTCVRDADCSEFDIHNNMVCLSWKCECSAGYIYNRKVNKCVFSKATMKGEASQSSTKDDSNDYLPAKAVDVENTELTLTFNPMYKVDPMKTFSFTKREVNPWWMVDLGEVHTLVAFQIITPPVIENFAELWVNKSEYESGKVADAILSDSTFEDIPSLIGSSIVEVIAVHGPYAWKFESDNGAFSLVVNGGNIPGKHVAKSTRNSFGSLPTNQVMKASRAEGALPSNEVYSFKELKWGGASHPLEQFEFETFDVNNPDNVHYYRKDMILDESVTKKQCIQVIGAKQKSSDVAVTLLAEDDVDPKQYWFTITDKTGSYVTEETSAFVKISDYGIHDFTVAAAIKIDMIREPSRKCTHVSGGPEPGKAFFMDCDTPVAGRYVAFYMSNDNPDESIKLTDVQLFTLPGCYGNEALKPENTVGCSDIDLGCEQLCLQDDVNPCLYRCGCEKGYQLNRDGKTCSDIDECQFTHVNCREAECINTPGNYSCECKEGYQVEGDNNCVDIDECSLTSDCPECENTIGSFTCTCSEGYEVSSGKCSDIDECAINNGGCSHMCTNTDGSFSCECDQGYSLSAERYCIDVDECETVSCDGICMNNVGSYRCECMEGFRSTTEDSSECADINECDLNNGGCDHSCENSIGSYKCLCDEGFTLLRGGSCTSTKEVQLRSSLAINYKHAYGDVLSSEYQSLKEEIDDNLSEKICLKITSIALTCQVVGALRPMTGDSGVVFDFSAVATYDLSTKELVQVSDELKLAFQESEAFVINGNTVEKGEPKQFLAGTQTQWSLSNECDILNGMGHCVRGKCVIYDGKAVCACPLGYVGKRCEIAGTADTLSSSSNYTERKKIDYAAVRKEIMRKELSSLAAWSGFSTLAGAWLLQFALMFICICIFKKNPKDKKKSEK